jgi:hypothetical protein
LSYLKKIKVIFIFLLVLSETLTFFGSLGGTLTIEWYFEGIICIFLNNNKKKPLKNLKKKKEKRKKKMSHPHGRSEGGMAQGPNPKPIFFVHSLSLSLALWGWSNPLPGQRGVAQGS